MCAIRSKPYGWDLKRKDKISSKNTKGHFCTFYISSKTVQAIETTFYIHSTSYYRTMCSIRSKLYGWDQRRKDKISSKNTKKPFLDFFNFSKTVQTIDTIFYSHSTSYWGTMCAIRSNPYGWDLRKVTKISSKDTRKAIFGLFILSRKLCRRLKQFFSHSTSFYCTMCAISSKPCGWDLRKKAKNSLKKAIFGTFISSQKLCRQLKRFLQSFLILLGHHVCNQIKTVWLGSEKESQN